MFSSIMAFKPVSQFKAGDIVHFRGAQFRIIENAYPAHGFAPFSKHDGKLRLEHGPAAMAEARGEWIAGEIVPREFGPRMLPVVFQDPPHSKPFLTLRRLDHA